MRKLLLIMIFIFPIISIASYLPESDIGSCADGRVFYTKKARCETANPDETCYRLSTDYKCSYHVVNNGAIKEDLLLKTAHDSIRVQTGIRTTARRAARIRLKTEYDCKLQPTPFLKDICRVYRR